MRRLITIAMLALIVSTAWAQQPETRYSMNSGDKCFEVMVGTWSPGLNRGELIDPIITIDANTTLTLVYQSVQHDLNIVAEINGYRAAVGIMVDGNLTTTPYTASYDAGTTVSVVVQTIIGGGKWELVGEEIKPEHFLKDEQSQAKIEAAKRYCEANGLDFEIWTDEIIEKEEE